MGAALLILALTGLGLAARGCGQSALGRTLYEGLVVAPCAWLSRLRPRHALALAVAVAAVLALAPAFPVELALVTAADLTLYLEAALAVAAMLSAVRVRALVRQGRALAAVCARRLQKVTAPSGGPGAEVPRRPRAGVRRRPRRSGQGEGNFGPDLAVA